MDETTMDLDEQRRSLLDALRFFVGKICEEQFTPKFPSREFVSALAGLCFTLVNDHLPRELLAFAKHANRKQIKDEDLFLYCRKTSLQTHLKEYRELMTDTPKKPSPKAKRATKTLDDFGDSD
jgi:hypothetical protein